MISNLRPSQQLTRSHPRPSHTKVTITRACRATPLVNFSGAPLSRGACWTISFYAKKKGLFDTLSVSTPPTFPCPTARCQLDLTPATPRHAGAFKEGRTKKGVLKVRQPLQDTLGEQKQGSNPHLPLSCP